jgi:hypothetical protein
MGSMMLGTDNFFMKAKIRQAHLFPLFFLAVISITNAYGQETAFSLESKILTVPVLEVRGVGYYKVKLTLVENSRFKLTSAEQIDFASTENVYQTATSKMILPKVAVRQGRLQGGAEIARYELHLLLEDLESLLFSVSYVNELSLAPSVSREKICSDYGCFELQTKLTGQEDGVIYRGSGTSPNKVLWERDELDNISTEQSLPSLSNIERVGHKAAPSAVVVFGDWCMDQSNKQNSDGSFGQVIYHSTIPETGFFVSDSLVLTTTKVLRTMEYGDAYMQLPGPPPYSADACTSYGEEQSYTSSTGIGNIDYNLESGAGPVIQLFDGRWALGEIVWADDATGLSAFRLVAVTDERRLPFASWASWNGPVDNQHWLSLRATDLDQIGKTATVHHPDLGRSDGGWFVSPSSAMNCSINTAQTDIPIDPLASQASIDAYKDNLRLYLNHYSDPASNGAPIVDDAGVVIAIVESQRGDPDGALCPAYKTTTTKNSLGPLPRYYADNSYLTVGALITSALIDALKIIDPSIGSNPATRSEELPIRPSVSLENFQRFEVPVMNDEFTVSGFPVSELNSTAIDTAKQGTLAFIRDTGCPTCDENRLNSNFDVPCICTGFAVSEHLIVTNDHCVTYLSIGAKTTFRTFYGQDVEAELVGKSSLDGETEMNLRYIEIFGNQNGDGVAPTGFERGDVALLRTSQAMKLIPLKLANSSTLEPWEPLITVGHPQVMLRSGPWVTGVGSFLGADYYTRTSQAYNLPASRGASGSAVLNLKGEVVGQIANGGIAAGIEKSTVLPRKYNLFAVELEVDPYETSPAPYSRYSGIPVSPQVSQGAPSNYIKEMIDKWAPGELP